MGKSYTCQEVRQTLQHANIEVTKINEVSKTMFKIGMPYDTIRYGKIVPTTKLEMMDRLIELGGDIGMPKSQLVRGQPSIHLMEPAEGKTLSYEIPLRLIPGMYYRKCGKLYEGMYDLGQYLGKLHDSTASGKTIINYREMHLDEQNAIKQNGVDSLLRNALDETVISDLNNILQQIAPPRGEKSIIHGDLRLFHVYLSDSSVELIDFDSTTRTIGIIDAISFECSLNLMISRLPWGSQKKYRNLLNEFYRGYYDEYKTEKFSENKKKCLKLIKYCSILLYYLERIEKDRHGYISSKADLTQTIDIKIIKKLIRNELTELRENL